MQVNNTSEEYNFAQDALFSRHPAMKSWPKGNDFYNETKFFFSKGLFVDHHFFVAKIDIEHVGVIDYFGGVKHVSVADYFAAKDYAQKFELNNVEIVEIRT